jgi:uncharacterized membrane protein HdeD (DUF308 family)
VKSRLLFIYRVVLTILAFILGTIYSSSAFGHFALLVGAIGVLSFIDIATKNKPYRKLILGAIFITFAILTFSYTYNFN